MGPGAVSRRAAVEETGSSMQLAEALGVGPGDVVALVGGGGKTSALYRLGHELAGRTGVAVVLAGTTRFTPPERGEPPHLTVLDAAAPPDAAPPDGPWPMTMTTGHGSKGRLLPVSVEWVDALHARRPQWVIVLEADGSAMRPFKTPAAHEPVIPASATLVVPVVGIDAAGRPLDDTHVHRAQIVSSLTGTAMGGTVDERIIADTLCHPDGGRKGVPPGARWVPLINKADTAERLARAETLAALLQLHTPRVVIARLRSEPPVVRIAQPG